MFTEFAWLWYVLGYAIACFGAHFIVGPTVNKLWKLTEADFQKKRINIPKITTRPNATVSFWYGVTERAVYASCIVFSIPEGIAVWLTFKAVVRWKMSEVEDPRHIPGSSIYMIGTAMNIGFGIIGGLIALKSWSF